jgi:hypothetical protein
MSKAMRLWGAALGVLVAGTLFVRLTEAQSVRKPPVLEASRVVIRDVQGRMRGVIGITEDNESGLTFFDASGKQRCRILVEPDGASRLSLEGADEQPLVTAQVGADGSATLGVHNASGDLGLVSTHAGHMAMILSRAGKARLVWGEDARGQALPAVTGPTSPPGPSVSGPGSTAPGPW